MADGGKPKEGTVSDADPLDSGETYDLGSRVLVRV